MPSVSCLPFEPLVGVRDERRPALSRRAAELRAKLARPDIAYWIEIAAVIAALVLSIYLEFCTS
jgi:hypothetical protein